MARVEEPEIPAAPLARLLIVDDEAAQMKALCDTLRDQGYETVGVLSGFEGLQALRSSVFDLLITDLMMPGMDGITFLRAALETDPNLVGIIMTGDGTIKTAVEAMKIGALDYILKPFKLSLIVPVLSRALAVRQLRIEKVRLENDLKARTEDLEALNADLEAFSYSVSHDLRAPLRAISGFSKILLEDYAGGMEPDARELLDDVVSSARRMEHLIEDLLRFSRLGRKRPLKEPFSMSELVSEVLTELQKEEAGRCIELRIAELPDATGDRALLKQVMVNLLSNAFKFTRQREGALIEIGYCDKEDGTVYFVRDNGAGFDMQYADRLFGVFQRLHSEEQFAGTGVGLSIVHRIIRSHGGRISAEGAVGEGAVFHFTVGSGASG